MQKLHSTQMPALSIQWLLNECFESVSNRFGYSCTIILFVDFRHCWFTWTIYFHAKNNVERFSTNKWLLFWIGWQYKRPQFVVSVGKQKTNHQNHLDIWLIYTKYSIYYIFAINVLLNISWAHTWFLRRSTEKKKQQQHFKSS